jgi:predicted negative regulator of RcsB-dependent stress response
MAKNIMQSIGDSISSVFESIFGDFKYIKELLLAIVIIGLAVGGYFGFRWYQSNQEYAVHQLFAHNVEEFERVLEEGKPEDWANIETLFQLGHDQHPKSTFAPLFLLYKAEAMIKQNKDAKSIIADAISALPHNSPVKSLYATKLALMYLDAAQLPEADKQVAIQAHDKGLGMLKDLARDSANKNNDVAAYYLGLYYWNKNDMAQAKEAWQKLVDSQKNVTDKLGQSPWFLLAQEKLNQLA